MARRSLKPHLNQIRSWVRQGRTDAWIAHQLEVTVQQIESFKRDNELAPDDGSNGFGDDVDLRAEDDALIAAELEAAEAEAQAGTDDVQDEAGDEGEAEGEAEDEGEGDKDDDDRPPRRRRGRRGGRGRRKGPQELEGTFDHGEEGYGLWLDPAVQDDPVYAEHWAGHRPVTVTVEEEQIVIRRSADEE